MGPLLGMKGFELTNNPSVGISSGQIFAHGIACQQPQGHRSKSGWVRHLFVQVVRGMEAMRLTPHVVALAIPVL
jgi:hypothetical protein